MKPNPNFYYSTQFNLMFKAKTIVVEGADCTGKTTLAKYLAAKLKAAYFHSSARGSLKLAQYDYLRNVLDNAKNCQLLSDLPVVLDRHWPSEECYAPIMRPEGRVIHNGNVLTVCAQMAPTQEFFAELQRMNTVYVFCIDDNAIERHEQNKDKDHAYTTNQYIQIYFNYLNLARKLLLDGIDLIYYNLSKDGSELDKVLERINTIYGQKEVQAGHVKQSKP